ncbi:hypothetical protein D3C85_1655900 [compost metagenome]
MVSVCVLMVPSAALVGFPKVNITVSSGSSRASSLIFTDISIAVTPSDVDEAGKNTIG